MVAMRRRRQIQYSADKTANINNLQNGKNLMRAEKKPPFEFNSNWTFSLSAYNGPYNSASRIGIE